MTLMVGINFIRKVLFWCGSTALAVVLMAAGSDVFAQHRIAPDQTLVLELTSSAPQVVSFDASAGELVEFSFSHRATSLKVTVTSPSRRKVAFFFSPTLFNGTLPVPFRTMETGIHKVTLEAERPGKTVGEVSVKLAMRRPVEAADEDRLKGYGLISKSQEIAQELMRIGTDRSKHDVARQALTDAISICDRIKDRRCVAIAALESGKLEEDEFGDFARAEVAFRRAVEEYVALSDVAGESLSKMKDATMISMTKGRDPIVMRFFDEALAGARSIKDAFLEGRILTQKGRILRDWNEGGKGIELVRQAIELIGDGDVEGRLVALIYATSITKQMDDRSYEIYSEQMYETMDRIEGRFHPEPVSWILLRRAWDALYRGDLRNYRLWVTKSNAVAESLGQKRVLARQLYWVGNTLLEINRPDEAFPYLVKSLRLYEEFVPRESQGIYFSLGKYYLTKSNPRKAKEFLVKAVALCDESGDKHAAIRALTLLADSEVQLGNYWEALTASEKAYYYSLVLRGNYYTTVSSNNYDLTYLREASERMITALYKVYEKSGDKQYLDRALEIHETSVAQSLLKSVFSSGFNITNVIDERLLTKLSNLQTEISQTQLKIQENPKNKAELKLTLLRQLVEYDSLLDEIRKRNPNAALFGENIHLPVEKIRSLVDADTVLVKYSIKQGESHAWVVSKERSLFYSLGEKKKINALVDSFISEISGAPGRRPFRDADAGEKLYDAILKPIMKDIRGFKRLLIVPDDDLVAVPFGAIPIARVGRVKYLTEDFEIGVLPSVSTLLATRQASGPRSANKAENLMAVVADPVFDGSDERLGDKRTTTSTNGDVSIAKTISGSRVRSLSRLPFTTVEAREITGFASGKGRIFSGLDAQRSKILSGILSDYRIVHFATHGFLNTENPELSALALSMFDGSGNPTNGFLRAIDIYSLNLKADLVVLSGCQTAGVAQVRGDYLAGLTRGFMYAGVPTVMASLWKVDDSATSYFMGYFYEGLLTKGMTPTAALRDAQLRFIKSPRWNSPKYWAAYTVQGEYDVTFK